MHDSIALTRNTFHGDVDIRRLRDFICSEHQYAGDTRWHAGTSLKAMWLSLYEFTNVQAVVEYWTTKQNAIAGVILVSPDQWRMQAGPDHRDEISLALFTHRADRLCATLANTHEIKTQAYASATSQIQALENLGYCQREAAEVFMTCKLHHQRLKSTQPSNTVITQYNPADPAQRAVRALIQADAFSDGQPSDDIIAWHLRNVDRMQMYSSGNTDFLASTENGESVAFASVQIDHINKIAEIEPVGTRTSFQRQGIARNLLEHCLNYMEGFGINSVFIRTGMDNSSAIAAYESVGFEIQDHLHSYARPL